MPRNITVRKGDCVTNISEKNGFFWNTVWSAPENSDLKKLRKDPNALLAGDKIVIPDKQKKLIDGSTNQTHKFVKKGIPAKMKIRLLIEEDPIANSPYSMTIDKEFWSEGKTDSNGYINIPIPPKSEQCEVKVGPWDDQHIFAFQFGSLDPIDTDDGVLKRLFNLGYEVEDEHETAVRAFQQDQGLDVTGIIDQATRDSVKKVFGQ